MKKKSKIILISIFVFIVLYVIFGIVFVNMMYNKLSNNIKLDTKKYKTAIEVKSNCNFIMYFNKSNKLSNIIFLDSNSVKYLFNKKIENKNIDEAIEKVIKNIYVDSFMDNEFKLINYGDELIYDDVKKSINKQFVINAINKNIVEENNTLNNKLVELNINTKDEKEIKALYDYSLEMVNNYNEGDKITYNEEDIDNYSVNGYKKLAKYALNNPNVEVNAPNKLDITKINVSDNYNNQVYPDSSSWYYIKDKKVYAYIVIKINNKNYEYCYMGNEQFKTGKCE